MTPPASTEPVFGILLSELTEWERENLCWSEVQDLQQRIRARGIVLRQAPAVCESEIQMLQNLDAHLYAKQQEHDAAIAAEAYAEGAAAERERVLKKILSIVDDTVRLNDYASYIALIEIIKTEGNLGSLRQPEQGREPE